MPRHKGIAPEVAVALSPLFRLPLEIRTMIYELLLHSQQDILIPHEQYKRKRISRIAEEKPSFTSICRFCGSTMAGRSERNFHMYINCRVKHSHDAWVLTKIDRKGYRGPGLSPALLRTCRLIHLEAVPIIYRSNSLRFEDVAALSAFRWGADTEQAGFVRRIHLMLPKGCAENTAYRANPWLEYITRARFGFATDFPSLKGVTITFSRGLAVADAGTMKSHLNTFMKYMYRLDWIQLIGLNDVGLLGHLKPILKSSEQPDSQKVLRTQTSKYDTCVGWTNASIWWGMPDSKSPCEIPSFNGDPCQRWCLYRYQDGVKVSYTAGGSVTPQI